MTRTSNYDLIVVEGSDKVNLLTQMNPNTEKIDEVLKTNEKSGVQVATELLTGTVHAITRTVKSASMFKFTAVSNYTSGDTFTVDGVQVTALLTSGEALGTGAYIIGSEVLCSLKDTLLTVYTQGGTVKIAEDAEKLGGNLPEYYAKQSELDVVKNTADSASSLSRQNSESINKINQSLIQQKIQYKDTSFEQVKINRKSGRGLYYSDNIPLGINNSFVISLMIIGWGGASKLFNIYYDYDSNSIIFMCDSSITITSVSIRVCYIQKDTFATE
jgi:hypothetical protein